MSTAEEIIDELLTMTKEERVEYHNEMQHTLTVVKQHLQDPAYLNGSGLKYNREKIINFFIKKGCTHNNWLLTEEQISDNLNTDKFETRDDLDYLEQHGWLTQTAQRNRMFYTLTKEVRNGSKRSNASPSLYPRQN